MMRHYDIYLIEEEVARSYYGKEALLFQLFLDERVTTSILKRKQIEKQVAFVTQRMPIFHIECSIEEALRSHPGYDFKQQHHMINNSERESQAELFLGVQSLTLTASGTYEAETTFFEVLRQINSCFLAVEFNHYRYGWLKPIKNAHLM